jgi:hypothetical protein
MKKRAKGQFERKYLPEGPYEKVYGGCKGRRRQWGSG